MLTDKLEVPNGSYLNKFKLYYTNHLAYYRWAFSQGPAILSAGTLFSSIYINRYVRKHLKLKTYAFLTTYMATCVPPGAISPILHGIVSNKMQY